MTTYAFSAKVKNEWSRAATSSYIFAFVTCTWPLSNTFLQPVALGPLCVTNSITMIMIIL
jgi:hypothetical protein